VPLEIISPDTDSGPVSIDVAENVAVALKLEPMVETLQRRTQFKGSTPDLRNRKLQINLYNLAVQSGVLDWPWIHDPGGRSSGWGSCFMLLASFFPCRLDGASSHPSGPS
jgi:hypothetical protein